MLNKTLNSNNKYRDVYNCMSLCGGRKTWLQRPHGGAFPSHLSDHWRLAGDFLITKIINPRYLLHIQSDLHHLDPIFQL